MRLIFDDITIKIPFIHLNSNVLMILSYVSIILFICTFLTGVYLIYKGKKYGIVVLCSSTLLLINPLINLIFM